MSERRDGRAGLVVLGAGLGLGVLADAMLESRASAGAIPGSAGRARAAGDGRVELGERRRQ
jgi:hypothetical protein